MIEGAPPAAQKDPQGYYYWLVSNGFPHRVAYDETVKVFGPPKTKEQQEKEAAKKEQEAQLAQVGGMVGGTVVTGAVLDRLGKSPAPTTTPTNTSTPTGSGAPSTPKPISAKPVNIDTSVTEVGSTSMPDGSPGTLMSDGAKVGQNGKIVNPDGSSGGNIQGQALAGLQVVGGAAQAYNGYKQYQSGEKIGGAANMAGGAYATAAGVQSLANGGVAGSLGQYAPAVGTAVAAAQIGQQMASDKGASEDRAAKSQAEAIKGAMLWIPGYGWVAYAALAGLDAVTGGKATEGLVKFSKFNNKVTDKIDFGLGKSIRSKVFHQSTKGRQEMHTGQLMQQSDDPQWQNYVATMRMQQIKEGPKDKTKPFYKGNYSTWNEYKQAGLQADDLTGVYGNLDAFKPDYAEKAGVPNWSNLNFDQRKAVTQRLIDEDMYSSKKGEVVIADKEKARRIYEEMSKNNFGSSSKQTGGTSSTSQVSTRPPAPLPRNAPSGPIPASQAKRKESIGDVLRRLTNKG